MNKQKGIRSQARRNQSIWGAKWNSVKRVSSKRVKERYSNRNRKAGVGMIYRTLARVKTVPQGQSYHSNSVTNCIELTGRNCEEKEEQKCTQLRRSLSWRWLLLERHYCFWDLEVQLSFYWPPSKALAPVLLTNQTIFHWSNTEYSFKSPHFSLGCFLCLKTPLPPWRPSTQIRQLNWIKVFWLHWFFLGQNSN